MMMYKSYLSQGLWVSTETAGTRKAVLQNYLTFYRFAI